VVFSIQGGIMNKEELRKFVLENPELVDMKRTSKEGIYILKYKKTVFFNSLWNEFLEECRGTIIDSEFNVISRPFTKIYNFGVEEKSPKLPEETPIIAYRKVNGFMVAVTLYNNEPLISTTGTIDSQHVIYAKEMMLKSCAWSKWVHFFRSNPNLTFMFECVHKEDPHIIAEDEGIYLLGWRENRWDSKVDGWLTSEDDVIQNTANHLGCKFAESHKTSVGELIILSKKIKHEGFVFYTQDNISAKIKTPYYLVKKFIARAPRDSKLMNPNVKKNVDEEYYPLIDAIQANIRKFMLLSEQARLEWITKFLTSGSVEFTVRNTNSPIFYMLIGVPGSGKSTWIKDNITEDFTILSTDDYIERKAKEEGKSYNEAFNSNISEAFRVLRREMDKAISEKRNIVWDQTNTDSKSRRAKLNLIPSFYRKVAVVISLPERKELERRLLLRPGKTISNNTLEDMINMFIATIPNLHDEFEEILTSAT
jgi:predicted kinase